MNETEMMSPFDYGDAVRVSNHTDVSRIGKIGCVVGYQELSSDRIVNGINYPKGTVLIWVEDYDGADDFYDKSMLVKLAADDPALHSNRSGVN